MYINQNHAICIVLIFLHLTVCQKSSLSEEQAARISVENLCTETAA